MLVNDDELGEQSFSATDIANVDMTDDGLTNECTISYNALAGNMVPKTLRFQGVINSKTISIMVD